AFMEFTASAADTSTVTLTINGQAADNPGTFTSANNNISGRTTTTSSVSWALNNTTNWVAEQVRASPDIATIVKEIVDRSNWESGNSLALIVTGNSTSNIRRAYGFEGGPGKAARLIINYRDDGSTVIGRTVRDELVSAVDALSAEGYTPIQDVMYEAAQYYRGGSVLYGGRRGGPPYTAPTTRSDGGPFRYTRVSHPDSLQSGTINTPASCSLSNYSASACATETLTANPQYESPIEVSCQQNYVVLLTDGEANKPHSSSLLQSLINTTSCTGSGGEACVRNLAKWMYDNDMSSSVTRSEEHTSELQSRENLVCR